MTANNFKTLGSYLEIISIVNSSEASGSLIWQTYDRERIIHKIDKLIYREKKQTIEFHLKDYKLDGLRKETIYVQLSHRTTIFKAAFISLRGNILVVKIPAEVKALELRSVERTHFDLQQEKVVTVEYNHFVGEAFSGSLNFKVIDISEHGLGLIISENSKDIIAKSNALKITHFESIKLSEPISMQLCYLEQFRYRLMGELQRVNRAGFSFETKMNKEEFTFLMGL